MPKLNVVIVSTRPGRVGLPVATWFVDRAKTHGRFDVEVTDLKELNLPALDEPKHPRLGQYQHEHTKRWSERVAASDAFVFVTPEYNFSTPPALINAVDYLFSEWHYKAAGLVTYGGVSGGLRAAQMTKLFLGALKMVPLVESVTIPFVANHLGDDGVFRASEAMDKSANVLLDELLRWDAALLTLRKPQT